MTQTGDESGDHRPVFESLTEKQLEAVREATTAGFYARPQQATAEEVAQRMGLSRSTFLYHLHGAEEKIFQAVFETDADEDSQNAT
jgi:predicted DNA binding protein